MSEHVIGRGEKQSLRRCASCGKWGEERVGKDTGAVSLLGNVVLTQPKKNLPFLILFCFEKNVMTVITEPQPAAVISLIPPPFSAMHDHTVEKKGRG